MTLPLRNLSQSKKKHCNIHNAFFMRMAVFSTGFFEIAYQILGGKIG